MAYTTIDDPSAYFQTKIYTGNGANNRALTFDGNSDLQPDWLWIKNRNETQSHALFNSVRGATLRLTSNGYGGESTENTNLDSFDSDGFTVDSELIVNGNADNMVAWGWKAGTSFSNDASSTSVGSIDSAGSVNTDAGFSIQTYTGTGSEATIGHGLGATPKIIFYKRLTGDGSWVVQSTLLANRTQLVLNGTDAATTASNLADNTNWSSSVFAVGTNADMNADGVPYIAYCFAEKKGYLKTGKWIGNGNNNGPFSFCGFKPAFILIKRTDTAKNWYINDNKRLGYNVNNPYLSPNITAAETGGTEIDILSNGFKIRASGTGHNQTGGTYIFMAIAENPFVTSTGVPATAR